MSNLATELAASPLFEGTSRGEIESIVRSGQGLSFEAKSTFVCEGDEPAAYFLLEGSVRVFHTSESGQQVVVKIFKPPALFGEIEAIVGISFLENVEALEPVRVFRLSADAFGRALDASPRLTRTVLADVSTRFCTATRHEKSLAFERTRKRLASFLCAYASFDGEDCAEGRRLRLRLTQNDMASALGVTQRAVATEIARWTKLGLIRLVGGYYVLTDIEALDAERGEPDLDLTHRIGRGADPS